MAAKDGNGRLRLDKFLADMGVGTRSQVKEMARKGRICLNGVPVKYLQGLPEGPLRVLEQGRFQGLGEMRGGELVKIKQFV